MKKNSMLTILLTATVTACMVGGCSKSYTLDTKPSEIPESQTYDSQLPDSESTESSLPDSQTPEPDTSAADSHASFTYSDIANREFWFGSGAGGWCTTLTIHEDGTFAGQYHDMDMGSIDDEFPNGTMYLCNFTGKLSNLTPVNEYTFSARLESMILENEPETEDIIDGIKTIYCEPHGLNAAKELLFYLPGAPVSELPPEYIEWSMSILDDTVTELPFYGLYNVQEMTGFSSYERTESSIDAELEQLAQQAALLEEQLISGLLSQIELNQTSYQLYMLWDDELNSIWGRLKDQLDPETMETLTTEQREWIKYKEAEIEAAGAENAGGSMQSLLENDRGAELTRKRVYELAEYLR